MPPITGLLAAENVVCDIAPCQANVAQHAVVKAKHVFAGRCHVALAAQAGNEPFKESGIGDDRHFYESEGNFSHDV
jgi:hypothetical protein